MSLVLGLGSFLVGVLPLSFAFSSEYVAYAPGMLNEPRYIMHRASHFLAFYPRHRSFSWHGPWGNHPRVRISVFDSRAQTHALRGVEAVVSSHRHARTEEEEAGIPTSTIAISLLAGFVLMLVVEQLLAPHSHSPSFGPVSLHEHSTLEFDAELDELAHVEDVERPLPRPGSHEGVEVAQHGRGQAIALTLGLFIHALADGLALGASFLPTKQSSSSQPSELSFIVFMALMVHKGKSNLS